MLLRVPAWAGCLADPFHTVRIVTNALDVVRRATWNQLRQLRNRGGDLRRAYGFHSPTSALDLESDACVIVGGLLLDRDARLDRDVNGG